MCGMTSDPSLTADEQLVLRIHPHWKTLVRPFLVAVLVVAVALVAEVLIPSGSAAPAATGLRSEEPATSDEGRSRLKRRPAASGIAEHGT